MPKPTRPPHGHRILDAIEKLARDTEGALDSLNRHFTSILTLRLDRIEAMVKEVLHRLPAQPRLAFHFTVGPTQPKSKGTAMPLEIKMTSEEKVKITATPVTSTGNPAKVDGDVDFTVTSGDCTIERVDPTSAFIVSGAPGDSVVTVSADADLGDGVVTITDAITAHVSDPLATSLGLNAEAPVPK